MSLKHAILVLLENQPGSGYDLRRRFESGIGNFWHATHQQVYQELKKLHAERRVEFDLHSQTDKPDRKVYRITRAGRAELKRWFQRPVAPQRLKQALLVKLFGARLADKAALVEELQRHAQLHRKQMEEYLLAEQKFFAQDEATRRTYLGPYLTLRSGIRYARDWIEILDEAAMLLASGALPTKPVLGTRPVPAPRPSPLGKAPRAKRSA